MDEEKILSWHDISRWCFYANVFHNLKWDDDDDGRKGERKKNISKIRRKRKDIEG